MLYLKGGMVKEEKNTRTKKIIQWVAYIIPLIILLYIIWTNISPIDQVLVYDIGSSELNDFLYPSERISSAIKEEGVTYKKIGDILTYFDITVPPNTKQIQIDMEFKANESEKPGLKIGGRNLEGKWSYQNVYKGVYATNKGWATAQFNFNASDLKKQQSKVNFIVYNPKGDQKEFPLYLKQLRIELIK